MDSILVVCYSYSGISRRAAQLPRAVLRPVAVISTMNSGGAPDALAEIEDGSGTGRRQPARTVPAA